MTEEDKDLIIKDLQRNVQTLKFQLSNASTKINSLLAEVKEKTAAIRELETEVKNKRETIKSQREKTKQLEAIKSIAKIKYKADGK